MTESKNIFCLFFFITNEMSSEEGSVVDFETLKGFDDYEILNEYPFTIRKKSNKRVISESLRNNGYIQVNLNGKSYYKHRIIALQFLQNPDPINHDVIDHINHDRTDNHLSNLRWCSSSDNSKNISSRNGIQYEFVDDLPDDAMVIDFYNTKTERREFDNEKYYYWFDEDNNKDVFYGKITNEVYKILHHNISKSGNEWDSMRDKNNRNVNLYINRFKQQHDLI